MMTNQQLVERFVQQKMSLIEGTGAARCASAIARTLEDAVTQSAGADCLRLRIEGMKPVLETAVVERLRAELEAILKDPGAALAAAIAMPETSKPRRAGAA